ncbi:splicing regulatory glutamine/lysine-rich protein 1-like [Dermacentor silvarum]|uniref:splicing regulatory glutamine/lysine-rich protein 1-like n=1 Tax=Dermacentor silvarum TaxID=543639 RepID=UPI002100DD11|nr:splicing regulatory glutamine/lysine-rich protein 1-like [Dermacentor silvarum]
MDVCPNPQDKVCRGCDASNPGPDHQCSPRCKLCGGTHMTADCNCRARYKTPYVVTKRQWERHRAAEEAEEAAKATSSAGKSRSRSRTRSRGRSRSRSRTPDSRKQRRLRSRTPRRTATRDTKTTEKVSWADAVTGKRAPTAKAGDKTRAKTETEIAKLTQAIQALQKQIEHMQTQIRAKDEFIEQLQHAVKSGTDTEAMQETQEELIEDDEVVCPDTKRRPTPTETTQETQEEPVEDGEVEFPDTKRRLTPALTEATRRKRTRAAICDARIEALEARLSNLEETIIASITRTI